MKQIQRGISAFLVIMIFIANIFGMSAKAGTIYENNYSNTGNQRADIVGVALTQVGYREGSNNDTKYGDWYGLPNQPWCAMFISWCARQANIPTSILKNSAGASPKANYFNIPYYSGSTYTPKSGDLFFTTSFSHVGLVYYVEGDYFYTIEGNSNNSGSSEGIGVFSLRRKISNFYFGVPNYNGSLTPGGHSHSYSITESEAAHPHKEYKKCSCGDWQYTGNTIYISGCSYCNDSCNCSISYMGTYTTNNVSTVLRIRDTHSTSGNVIGEIPTNADFSVSKANGTWAHVTYNGVNGYVAQDYIKKVVPSQPLVVDTRYPTPIKMYTLSSNHYGANAYFTYEDLLAAPSTDGHFVYGDTDGKGDFVTINAVYTTQNVFLNCPWESSTKDVYSFGGQFFYDMTVTPKKQTAEKMIYTYIRAGSSIQLGYVDPGDLIYILGSQNGYTQIIYPFTADGTYRCGWCLTSELVHNHSYGAWSNYDSSVHMHSCICGAEETASHTWNEGVVSKNATCTSSGIKTYTCTGCNATKTEYIPTLAHNYTAGNYTETTHPHTIYNTCYCGARVESGYKQTVPSCTQCYPAPVISGIVSSKSNVVVGDTVTFTLNASGAKEYWLLVGDGTNVLLEQKQSSHSIAFTFASEGLYYVWGYAYNGEVYSSAEPISVNVKNKSYIIKFNANSGTGAPGEQTKHHDIALTLSSTKPTRTGYTFLGWSTSSTATSATYQPGGSFTSNADTTLYAVWKKGCESNDHNYTTNVTPPTCTEKGYTTHTCSLCGDSYKDTFTNLVKHDYANGKCTHCGADDPNYVIDQNAAQMTIDSVTATCGQTVTVNIMAKNMSEVKTLLIDSFKYDKNALEFVGGTLKVNNAAIADWSDKEMIASVAFSSNTNINGVVLTLTFKVKDGADGEYSISCEVYAKTVQNGQEEAITVSVVPGKINVTKQMRGDMDENNIVNSDDAIHLLRHTLFADRYPINQSGDMNRDGAVNSDDAIHLLRHTLFADRYPL